MDNFFIPRQGFDIDLVLKILKKNRLKNFAVSKGSCNNWIFISPIRKTKSGVLRYGAIFDNCNEESKPSYSEEETIMRFKLFYGLDVKYRWTNNPQEILQEL